jgi:hypothetical protein
LSQVEREAYHESLKHYRDLNNTIDTAFGEGYDEAVELMDKQLKQAEEEKTRQGPKWDRSGILEFLWESTCI